MEFEVLEIDRLTEIEQRIHRDADDLDDIQWLIAEVRRLRQEMERLHKRLAELAGRVAAHDPGLSETTRMKSTSE